MLSEKPWKPDLVIRLFAALLAGLALGSLIVQGYHSQIDDKSPSGRLLIFALNVISFDGVGLVLVHVFVRLHGLTWSQAFGFREPRLGRALFMGTVLGIMLVPIALSLRQVSAGLEHLFGRTAEAQEVVRMAQQARSGAEILLYVLVPITVVPLFEELIFRGILYPAIKQTGHRKLALWGTSVFFALTHLNVSAFVPLVVIGVLLTLLYETTNNLLAPIVTHSVFNLGNYAFMWWQNSHGGV